MELEKENQQQAQQQQEQMHQLDLAKKSMELRKLEAEASSPLQGPNTAHLKILAKTIGRTAQKSRQLSEKMFKQHLKQASLLDKGREMMEGFADRVTGSQEYAKHLGSPMGDAERAGLRHTPPDADPYAFRQQLPRLMGDAVTSSVAGWTPFGQPETPEQRAARLAVPSTPAPAGSWRGLYGGAADWIYNQAQDAKNFARGWGNNFAQNLGGAASYPLGMITHGLGNITEAYNTGNEYQAQRPGASMLDAPYQTNYASGLGRVAGGTAMGYLTSKVPLRWLSAFAGADALGKSFSDSADATLQATQPQLPPPPITPAGAMSDDLAAGTQTMLGNLFAFLQKYRQPVTEQAQPPSAASPGIPGVPFLAGA